VTDDEQSSVKRDPLTHPHQTAARSWQRTGDLPLLIIVEDFQLEVIGAAANDDAGRARLPVLQGTLKCLLHDAVPAHIEAGGQRTHVTFHPQLHR
jgi:hypothetical protein